MSFISYFTRKKISIIEEIITSALKIGKRSGRRRRYSTATLYYWRKQLRHSGAAEPNTNTSSEQWSAQTKLAIVAETYTMTENELSQYCREKGLFLEQIQNWRSECMQGFMSSKEREAETSYRSKSEMP